MQKSHTLANGLPSRLDTQPSSPDGGPILPGHISFDARDEPLGILSVLTLQPSGYLDAWSEQTILATSASRFAVP